VIEVLAFETRLNIELVIATKAIVEAIRKYYGA
jgi:hypothetical protein